MESCLSCVAMLVAGRWDHVVLCSYVPRGGSRFTYCIVYKQREEDICCSSSTTLHSIHFIHYSYPDPLLGKQLSSSGAISWFYQAERPSWGEGESDGWLVSILFVPFWKSPLSAHREALRLPQSTFQLGSWLLLAPKSQTCITWKVLHRFQRRSIIQKLKKGKLNRDACGKLFRGSRDEEKE